jgi:hypothetical protein
MQVEMNSVMSTVSRDFDETDDGDDTSARSEPPSAEEAALVQRAVVVTGWQIIEPDPIRRQEALALHEVRVMKKYRPRLLHAGTVASQIRCDVFRVLSQREGSGSSVPAGRGIFWDGILSQEQ